MKKIVVQLCAVITLGFIGVVNAQTPNSLTYSGDTNDVFSVEAGSTITIDFAYVTDAVYDFEMFVQSSTEAGIWSGEPANPNPQNEPDGNSSMYVKQSLPAAPGGGAGTYELVVPAETPLSASLTSPRKYYIFGKIEDDPVGNQDKTWAITDQKIYPELNVVAPGSLSINSFNAPGQAATLYMNHRSKSLVIAKTLDSGLDILDMTGRVVMTIDASETTSVSLAALRSGVYLVSNDQRTKAFKFAL